MILPCPTCAKLATTDRTLAQKFQDEKYGRDNRVHNPMKKGDKGGARCTCCGTEKSL